MKKDIKISNRSFNNLQGLIRSRSFVSLLILGMLWLVSIDRAYAQAEILFVLDSSGSMRQTIGGRPKIMLAKGALIRNLETVPTTVSVGLRVFAHRVEMSNKSASCKDTELLVPVGAANFSEVSSALSAASPLGYTPLAYSLQQVTRDFSPDKEGEKFVIVLSDGEETCGGDPISVVRELRKQGINITVHTIGFDVDEKTRMQLEQIAEAGGGSYFDAKDAEQLTIALADATEQAILKPKKKTEKFDGTPIRGGDNFDSAVLLDGNKLYRLDHHQYRGDLDYFAVKLNKGSQVILKAQASDLGISADSSGRVIENDSGASGLKFLSPTRQKLSEIRAVGGQSWSNSKQESVGIVEDGLHYILVGSDRHQHKDGAFFQYSVVSNNDLDGQQDAGDTWATARPISLMRYTDNFMGNEDGKDCYKINLRKGERYFVGFIPSDNFKGGAEVALADAYKREIFNETSTPGNGIKTKIFEIKEDGEYLLSISTRSSYLEQYAFEVKKVEGE